MFIELDEPRPWTMLRLGTAPWRPVGSCAWMRSSERSLNAETAAGTCWSDSSVRRAVTVITSPLASTAGAWPWALPPTAVEAGCSLGGGVPGWVVVAVAASAAKAGEAKAASATAALDSFSRWMLAMDFLLMIRLADRRGRQTGGPRN